MYVCGSGILPDGFSGGGGHRSVMYPSGGAPGIICLKESPPPGDVLGCDKFPGVRDKFPWERNCCVTKGAKPFHGCLGGGCLGRVHLSRPWGQHVRHPQAQRRRRGGHEWAKRLEEVGEGTVCEGWLTRGMGNDGRGRMEGGAGYGGLLACLGMVTKES